MVYPCPVSQAIPKDSRQYFFGIDLPNSSSNILHLGSPCDRTVHVSLAQWMVPVGVW